MKTAISRNRSQESLKTPSSPTKKAGESVPVDAHGFSSVASPPRPNSSLPGFGDQCCLDLASGDTASLKAWEQNSAADGRSRDLCRARDSILGAVGGPSAV